MKVALITGASSGIGAALAKEYARRKYATVLLARRAERLTALATQLRENGGEVLAEACDVTVDGDMERAVEATLRRFGRLDVAVANAGIGVLGKLEKLRLEEHRKVFETNVFGALRTAYASFEALKDTRGSFALLGSISGYVGVPGLSAYNASKFAVRAFAETLSHEWRSDGVAVTHIAPGFVDSEIRKLDNEGNLHADAKDPIPRWLVMPAEKAARQMVSGIEARRREVVITGHGKAVVFLSRLVPGLVAHALDRIEAPSQKG